jgi:phytoene synthase
VATLYAFCRFTDDLTDEPGGADRHERERQLDRWLALARRAHGGETTGVALVDRAMSDMASAGVPFRHVEELVEGMRMDLQPRMYRDLEELDLYLYRVASVVGIWLSGLFGVRDRALLARAADLGRAMQLTNILRDVGEDWRRGRLYLPLEDLRERGLTPADLGAMARGDAPVLPGYVELLEFLMAEAEERYEAALSVVPDLPSSYQRPVAVAAWVYRGIHDEIRRNGYDNLRRRAYTGPVRKAWLTSGALGTLALQRQRWRGLEDWIRLPADAGIPPARRSAPVPRAAPDGLPG